MQTQTWPKFVAWSPHLPTVLPAGHKAGPAVSALSSPSPACALLARCQVLSVLVPSRVTTGAATSSHSATLTAPLMLSDPSSVVCRLRLSRPTASSTLSRQCMYGHSSECRNRARMLAVLAHTHTSAPEKVRMRMSPRRRATTTAPIGQQLGRREAVSIALTVSASVGCAVSAAVSAAATPATCCSTPACLPHSCCLRCHARYAMSSSGPLSTGHTSSAMMTGRTCLYCCAAVSTLAYCFSRQPYSPTARASRKARHAVDTALYE